MPIILPNGETINLEEIDPQKIDLNKFKSIKTHYESVLPYFNKINVLLGLPKEVKKTIDVRSILEKSEKDPTDPIDKIAKSTNASLWFSIVLTHQLSNILLHLHPKVSNQSTAEELKPLLQLFRESCETYLQELMSSLDETLIPDTIKREYPVLCTYMLFREVVSTPPDTTTQQYVEYLNQVSQKDSPRPAPPLYFDTTQDKWVGTISPFSTDLLTEVTKHIFTLIKLFKQGLYSQQDYIAAWKEAWACLCCLAEEKRNELFIYLLQSAQLIRLQEFPNPFRTIWHCCLNTLFNYTQTEDKPFSLFSLLHLITHVISKKNISLYANIGLACIIYWTLRTIQEHPHSNPIPQAAFHLYLQDWLQSLVSHIGMEYKQFLRLKPEDQLMPSRLAHFFNEQGLSLIDTLCKAEYCQKQSPPHILSERGIPHYTVDHSVTEEELKENHQTFVWFFSNIEGLIYITHKITSPEFKSNPQCQPLQETMFCIAQASEERQDLPIFLEKCIQYKNKLQDYFASIFIPPLKKNLKIPFRILAQFLCESYLFKNLPRPLPSPLPPVPLNEDDLAKLDLFLKNPIHFDILTCTTQTTLDKSLTKLDSLSIALDDKQESILAFLVYSQKLELLIHNRGILCLSEYLLKMMFHTMSQWLIMLKKLRGMDEINLTDDFLFCVIPQVKLSSQCPEEIKFIAENGLKMLTHLATNGWYTPIESSCDMHVKKPLMSYLYDRIRPLYPSQIPEKESEELILIRNRLQELNKKHHLQKQDVPRKIISPQLAQNLTKTTKSTNSPKMDCSWTPIAPSLDETELVIEALQKELREKDVIEQKLIADIQDQQQQSSLKSLATYQKQCEDEITNLTSRLRCVLNIQLSDAPRQQDSQSKIKASTAQNTLLLEEQVHLFDQKAMVTSQLDCVKKQYEAYSTNQKLIQEISFIEQECQRLQNSFPLP